MHKVDRTITALVLLLLLLAGCRALTASVAASTPDPTRPPGCPPCRPTPTATCPPCWDDGTPTPEPVAVLWDERLTQLGLRVHAQESNRYGIVAAWVTIDGQIDSAPAWAQAWYTSTFPEAGGDHHAFGSVIDIERGIMAGTFVLSWSGGAAERAPEPSGWANIPLYAGYHPDRGEVGGYTWAVVGGDELVGLGLPGNRHYSFFVVWKLREGVIYD